MARKRSSVVYPFCIWVKQLEVDLFFQDLKATLDGVECGELEKSAVSQLCRRNNARFHWVNYSLELLNQKEKT